MAVAQNDFLYVSDQNHDHIKIIDNNLQLIGTIPTGRVPTGVTFGPDGFLYYTDTPFRTPQSYLGRLVKVDPVSLQQTVLFDDLPFPSDVEFMPDGSYYLSTFLGQQIDRYSANNVLLNSFSDGWTMDQLAFYAPVPEPGSMILLSLAATAGLLRQRRSRSRNIQVKPQR